MSARRGSLLSTYTKKTTYSNNVPSSTTLTYEGLFSENYFKINKKEKNYINNIEISYAHIINPLTNDKETWIGLQTKSKYDGTGIREPIDICILIDISGSMSSKVDNNMSRLDMAKKSVLKFISNINDNDNICIMSFDDNTEEIIPMTKGDKFKKDFQIFSKKINDLVEDGGTELFPALDKAYITMKEKSNNTYKRIIFITDMLYYDNPEFNNLCKKSSEENIFITFLGISEDFNTELVEKVADMRGCNYYVIRNEKDIQRYLIDEFNYTCFASAINTRIELLSPNLKIDKVIGTGYKNSKEINDNKLDEWFPSKHSTYENQSFRKNVMFLMLYFNRINRILPKPILASFCNFLKCERKLVCNINTTFPSTINQGSDGNLYVEGGIMLIKLKNESLLSNNLCQFNIKYTGLIDNKEYSHFVSYNIEKKDEIYYSDNNIKEALALYYFGKFNRRYMKICNEENKNEKYGVKYLISKNFTKDKYKIINLLRNSFDINVLKSKKEELLEKYLKKIKEMTKNAIKYAKENLNQKKIENMRQKRFYFRKRKRIKFIKRTK